MEMKSILLQLHAQIILLAITYKTLRVCVDLRKLEGKKKNLESNFLSIV